MERIKMRLDYTFDEIVQVVKKNPITIIAVDIKGTIKTCIPLKEAPSSIEEFDKLLKSQMKSEKGTEYSVSLIDQDKEYSEEKLLNKISNSIKALEYSRTHELKPGVNIPGNTKYYAIKKRLAKELKMKE